MTIDIVGQEKISINEYGPLSFIAILTKLRTESQQIFMSFGSSFKFATSNPDYQQRDTESPATIPSSNNFFNEN